MYYNTIIIVFVHEIYQLELYEFIIRPLSACTKQ